MLWIYNRSIVPVQCCVYPVCVQFVFLYNYFNIHQRFTPTCWCGGHLPLRVSSLSPDPVVLPLQTKLKIKQNKWKLKQRHKKINKSLNWQSKINCKWMIFILILATHSLSLKWNWSKKYNLKCSKILMHKGQTTQYFMHCFFVMPITVITDN